MTTPACLLNVAPDEEAILLPTGVGFAVKREHGAIVWSDALRDLQRLRLAYETWRDEAQRLTRECIRLRQELTDVLETPAADYRLDEVMDRD